MYKKYKYKYIQIFLFWEMYPLCKIYKKVAGVLDFDTSKSWCFQVFSAPALSHTDGDETGSGCTSPCPAAPQSQRQPGSFRKYMLG